MRRKRKPGRRLTFRRPVRRELAELIREHGARGAQELSSTPISLGTLLKIAKEFGITLQRGRRPRATLRLYLAPSAEQDPILAPSNVVDEPNAISPNATPPECDKGKAA